MRRIIFSVLGSFAVLAASVSAQPAPSGFGDMNQSLVFSPGAGLVFPVGDFDDANDMGYSVGAGLEYFVSPRIALSGNYAYFNFSDPNPGIDGENFHFLGLGARGLLFRDVRVNPYVRLAGGLYQASGASKAGINGGPGILYRATKNVGLWVEGNAHFVFDYGGGVNSNTANFLGVSAGLALTIPTGKKPARKAEVLPQAEQNEPPPAPKREPPPPPKREEPKPVEIVLQPVYFAINQHTLSPDARSTLDQNAELLRRHASVTVEIQANCDERGNVEYNRELGRKRAEMVRRYLMERGVDENRIAIRNFGEERPADRGHDEPSWSKNRRVDFQIISR